MTIHFSRLTICSAVRLAIGAGLALAVAAAGVHAADRKVIILEPLTGVAANVGVSQAAGLQFGADELNAKGFLGADKIVYEIADSASARAQSMAAVTRYAADPNVLMILGPITAVEAVPAVAVANDAKIPLYSGTNAFAVIKAGPWGFIASQAAPTTMPLLGDYVVNVAKAKTCASIHFSDNEAYVDLQRLFREHTEPKGLKFVDMSGVKQADSDFSAISTRVVAAKPECVVLFTAAPAAANLVIQLKQAGLPANVKLFGQTALASAQFISIGGSAVEGVILNSDWTPGGNSPSGNAFAAAFKKATGKDPDNFAALGYSFMLVAATAIKNASPNPTREKIRDEMAKTRDVPVVVGNGKYSLIDRVPSYGATFLQVKNGQFVAAPH